jgi:PLP dependent protein
MSCSLISACFEVIRRSDPVAAHRVALSAFTAYNCALMDESKVVANVRRAEDRIAQALARAGRSDAVKIVAVTKTHGPEAVRAAFAAGLTDCGENRVQELELKREADAAPVRWHLIGHLQRNKARRALPLVDVMHAVDSHRLAETLSSEAVAAGRVLEALVQVNASGEETKGGFTVTSAAEDVARIAELPGLSIEGLMTMAPYTSDERVLRGVFAAVRELSDACRTATRRYSGRHLSMGMSNDFELAVEEGSTMVRLGTVLFGERALP